ncbi:MAG: hypothetical protein ACNY01_13650 [Desulfobacteria bacterium]
MLLFKTVTTDLLKAALGECLEEWDALQFYSFNQTLKKEGASHIELFFHYSFDRLGNGTWRDSQMA